MGTYEYYDWLMRLPSCGPCLSPVATLLQSFATRRLHTGDCLHDCMLLKARRHKPVISGLGSCVFLALSRSSGFLLVNFFLAVAGDPKPQTVQGLLEASRVLSKAGLRKGNSNSKPCSYVYHELSSPRLPCFIYTMCVIPPLKMTRAQGKGPEAWKRSRVWR